MLTWMMDYFHIFWSFYLALMVINIDIDIENLLFLLL